MHVCPRVATTSRCEERVLQGELEPTNEGYALAKVVTQRLCQYLMRQHPGLNTRLCAVQPGGRRQVRPSALRT